MPPVVQRVAKWFRVAFTAQNLNMTEVAGEDVVLGSMWAYGRCRLRLGEEWPRGRWVFPTELSLEWVFGRKAHSMGFYFETGSSSLRWHVGIWKLFGLYGKISQPWLGKLLFVYAESPGIPSREVSRVGSDASGPGRRLTVLRSWTEHDIVNVSWVEGSLYWSFFHPTYEWTSGTPWWRHHCFHVSDWVLGRSKYSTVTLERREVAVPLPEGSYPATARLELSSWKRRFSTLRQFSVVVDLPDDRPVPVPGKGENSWDCGDDAIYSWSGRARTIEEGVGRLVTQVLSTRVRYGGPSWAPSGVA